VLTMADYSEFLPRVLVIVAGHISRWGEIGSPIEGSVYYRSYCRACGDPIRVEGDNCPIIACGRCRLAGHPGWNHSSAPLDEQAYGGWDNAVAISEDQRQ